MREDAAQSHGRGASPTRPASTGPSIRAAFGDLPIDSDLVLAELRSIVEYGERHHIDAAWFRALRRSGSTGQEQTRDGSGRCGDRVRRSLAKARLLDAARMVRSKLTLLAGGMTSPSPSARRITR